MARLPQPGGDAGNWGQILNDFLGEAHQSNGALKPDAVTETALATGDGANGDILIKDTAAPTGMKWATVSGVSGTGTNLSASSTATSISLSSSSGTGTVLSAATSIAAGILTAADKTKLDAIAAGATANSTDAQLRDRATHTGTQAISTVSGLQAALDAKAASSTVYTRSEVDTALAAKANTASLSAVAASGSYTDLTNRPTIPAQVNLAAGTNVTITGTYPNLTVAATPGAGVTDLSTTTTATNVTVVSSTGTDAVIAAATTTDAGVLSATDKTKLNGIATGATANATDAQLRDRSTHTGTQAIATVTGLQTAINDKADDSSVVQLTGAETVAGVKTFSSSPIVPTPTTNAQAANKSYVDSVAAAGASDATTSAKGIVQLAGDLGGTATSPTVPGLAGKLDATVTSPTNGQRLSYDTATSTWKNVSAAIPFATISMPGTLATGTISLPFPINGTWVFGALIINVGTTPTGGSVTADLLYNGTTVFTTSGNRPSIASGSVWAGTSTADITQYTGSTSVRGYLQFALTSVGASGTEGADLVATVYATRIG